MAPITFTAGAELPPLVIGRITRRDLALFAGGSGDHQPIHIDIDAARERGREDVIAHGMISMAYLGRYLLQFIPQTSLRSFKCRSTAVTPINAEPTCHGQVQTVKDGRATISLTVTLPDGTVTTRGEAIVSLD